MELLSNAFSAIRIVPDSPELRKIGDAWRILTEVDETLLQYGSDGIIPDSIDRAGQESSEIREVEEVKRGLQSSTQQGGSVSTILKSLNQYETVLEASQIARFGLTDQLPQSDELISDTARRGLDGRDFLDHDEDLFIQELFSGLRHQLSCCENSHAARWKLSQFFDKGDTRFEITPDLYLSASAEKVPRSWFETRLTADERDTSCAGAGCSILADAEKKNQILTLFLAKDADRPSIRHRFGPDFSAEDRPIRSLEELLKQQGALTRAQRARLNRELAAWLLRMSPDAFRRITLHARNIYFLHDPVTQRDDRRQPYFSWDIAAYERIQEDELVSKFKPLHLGERLLQFARLVLEVDYGKLIPSDDSPTLILEAIQKHLNSEVKQHSPIWNVVQSCLSLVAEASRPRNDDALQIWIFNHLVQELHKEFVGWARPVDESQDIRPFSSGNEPFYETTWPTNRRSKETEEMALQFMARMDSFVRDCVEPIPKVNSSPEPPHKIKIAIIDSGVAKDNIHLFGSMGTIIKDCRNFSAADPEDWGDKVGHGTSVACLLMDVAPHAELYIAKVTDSVKMGRDKRHCIAKAINWAVQKWAVDIISMSICLPEKDEGIQRELEEACDPTYDGPNATRKIVFAAAGNQGGNSPLAWPASEDNTSIIAINATDGFGNDTGTNPNPSRHDENFGTLGCDIKRPGWPFGQDEDVYLTGSSFATPIAAGIAANVLEFARHRLKLTARQKDRLYGGPCSKYPPLFSFRIPCMDGSYIPYVEVEIDPDLASPLVRKVFRKMATPNSHRAQNNRSNLTYLQPWTWWGTGSTFDKDSEICEDLKAIIRDI